MTVLEKFNLISTPEQLLEFMKKNINYGYLGKSGRVYHFDDQDFNEKWYNEYVLEVLNEVNQIKYYNLINF